MNKKFSTLLVGALLTTSLGAFAQGTTTVHTSHLNRMAKIHIFFGCTIFLLYFFPFNHAFLSDSWFKTYK